MYKCHLSFATIFLQWRGQKVHSTKWKVLHDMSWICEPRWKNKHPINFLLWWLTDRYYAHSYLTCWGYLNTPHEGTNSSLLQANSFPNAKTYVNGIQLLRKKKYYQYTFWLYIFTLQRKIIWRILPFPMEKKKSQENHPEYFATISGPSKSISSISKHAIS